MTAWPLPEINALVELTLAGERVYQTRVDAIDGTRLVVTAPPDLVIGDVPADGTAATVCWYGIRGRHLAKAQIVHTLLGLVSVWTLEITARPQVDQRRQHVRGGGGEPIELIPCPGDPADESISVQADKDPDVDPLHGCVVDLSEVGIRARFDAAPLSVGDGVSIQLKLGAEELDLTGTVVRLIVEPGRRGVEVVLRYAPDEARATKIRRHILNAQLRARATAGSGR